MKNGACVVAEAQEDLVVVLLEAPIFVAAHDRPGELILYVDGDAHQVVDLVIGGITGLCLDLRGVVDANRLIPFDDLLGEPLRCGAVCRIVVEALGIDKVEPSVSVLVIPREQHSLFCFEQRDGDAKDHRADVVGATEETPLLVELVDLGPQLAVPLPLRSQIGLLSQAKRPLSVEFLILGSGLLLGLLAVGLGASELRLLLGKLRFGGLARLCFGFDVASQVAVDAPPANQGDACGEGEKGQGQGDEPTVVEPTPSGGCSDNKNERRRAEKGRSKCVPEIVGLPPRAAHVPAIPTPGPLETQSHHSATLCVGRGTSCGRPPSIRHRTATIVAFVVPSSRGRPIRRQRDSYKAWPC